MKKGNPIPGLRIEQNPIYMMNQVSGQQNMINQVKQEPRNNIIEEQNNRNKNQEKINDRNIKINLKKNNKMNEMDFC